MLDTIDVMVERKFAYASPESAITDFLLCRGRWVRDLRSVLLLDLISVYFRLLRCPKFVVVPFFVVAIYSIHIQNKHVDKFILQPLS